MANAWLYDGRSAVRRSVTVAPDADGIRLTDESGVASSAPARSLTHVETRPDVEIYGHGAIPGWRLGIARPLPAELEPLLPPAQIYGRWIDRLGLPRALLIGAAASAAVLLAVWQLPALLAPHVPMAWEKKFGDALVGDLGRRFCAGPGGQEALDKLAARLSPGAGALNIRVVEIKMVNAVALPGGNIIIFRELLSEAESPDEAAGVVAHEIAHVENRDVTQAIIRHYGAGVLLASIGGRTAASVDTLLAARYSRGAESQADADAVAALDRANISPVPTARFFERLAKMEQRLGRFGDALSYVSSHPVSDERRRRFLASADKGRAYQPALSQDEWDALQDICHNDPKRHQPR